MAFFSRLQRLITDSLMSGISGSECWRKVTHLSPLLPQMMEVLETDFQKAKSHLNSAPCPCMGQVEIHLCHPLGVCKGCKQKGLACVALIAQDYARKFAKWCKLAEIYSTKRATHCSVSINLRKNTFSVVLAIKNHRWLYTWSRTTNSVVCTTSFGHRDVTSGLEDISFPSSVNFFFAL